LLRIVFMSLTGNKKSSCCSSKAVDSRLAAVDCGVLFRRVNRGFTLIEILVIISIIGLLMGILMPALSRAREQAKITVVNAELRQIGIALDMYFDDNHKFPPTREDCHTGKIKDHLYQLPKELAEGRYLPATDSKNVMTTIMEDRFNRGHTYKYRSPGEVYRDIGSIEKHIPARLWIPDNFPSVSSINEDEGRWYPNDSEKKQYRGRYSLFTPKAPVSWVVFSLGPGFDETAVYDKVKNRYPVSRELWYDSKNRAGFLVRLRLQNGQQIGTF